jgi:hypothetical protein
VAKFFIPLLAGLVAVLVWQIVATLLMRLFGVQLPLRLFSRERKRAVQLLTFSESVWYGVLFSGCGIWIGMTLAEYLLWKYFNGSSRDLSVRIRVYAVVWPAYGLFVGLGHWEDHNRALLGAAGSAKSEIVEHDHSARGQ